VDEGDKCRRKKWVKIKEMCMDVRDECGWRRWVWRDLYKKVRNGNCEWQDLSSLYLRL